MQYLLIPMSFITLILFGYDKAQARIGAQRIPENVLLLISILGGAIGGLLGMKIFRHKTKHAKFWIVLGLAAVAHIILYLRLTKPI